jgi:hypothetical protein
MQHHPNQPALNSTAIYPTQNAPTNRPQEPTTYFHELSHNFYLNHAGKWGNEGYDDMSGAMGYCCDVRCHNAPHSFQLGGCSLVCLVVGAGGGGGLTPF